MATTSAAQLLELLGDFITEHTFLEMVLLTVIGVGGLYIVHLANQRPGRHSPRQLPPSSTRPITHISTRPRVILPASSLPVPTVILSEALAVIARGEEVKPSPPTPPLTLTPPQHPAQGSFDLRRFDPPPTERRRTVAEVQYLIAINQPPTRSEFTSFQEAFDAAGDESTVVMEEGPSIVVGDSLSPMTVYNEPNPVLVRPDTLTQRMDGVDRRHATRFEPISPYQQARKALEGVNLEDSDLN